MKIELTTEQRCQMRNGLVNAVFPDQIVHRRYEVLKRLDAQRGWVPNYVIEPVITQVVDKFNQPKDVITNAALERIIRDVNKEDVRCSSQEM